MKTVEIAGLKLEHLDIDSLVIIQGDLKELSQAEYLKLRKEILKNRFNDPFQVWDDDGNKKIISGTQRKKTLLQMREEGYSVPKVPCLVVQADNEKQAREMLLERASAYGKVTNEGLFEFMSESELNLDDVKDSFRFPEVDLDEMNSQFNEDALDKKDKKSFKCPQCGYAP